MPSKAQLAIKYGRRVNNLTKRIAQLDKIIDPEFEFTTIVFRSKSYKQEVSIKVNAMDLAGFKNLMRLQKTYDTVYKDCAEIELNSLQNKNTENGTDKL
jgi:hypothetical protein